MRILMTVVAAGVLATGCSWNPPNDAEKENLRNEARMLSKKVQTLHGENQILNSLLQTAQIDRKKAEEMLAANQKYVNDMQELFNSISTIEGVSQTSEGVRIDDAVLFDSGSATLKEKGKSILAALAQKILEKKLKIRVDGHTDGQPIQRVKDKYETNWDLSAARAMTVLKYLAIQGVAPENMSLAAYAEYKPVPGEENSGEKPNRKNRRVEIAVLR